MDKTDFLWLVYVIILIALILFYVRGEHTGE